MPFYIADYLADTGHLDHEEHGVYLLAIMHYWQTEKPLPNNAKQLQQICHCFAYEKFKQIWDTVSCLFELTGDGWVHKRIEKELTKASEISKKRKEYGKKGGEKRAKQMLTQTPSKRVTQSQSQSHNKKIYKKRFFEFVFLDENEYEKLKEKFGNEKADELIQRLNDYIGSKGKKYKSHYHTILTWERKDASNKNHLILDETQEEKVIRLKAEDEARRRFSCNS